MMYNANKRSITVNLKSERGLALVKEMVKKADVFTENFAPGAVERLGLGYDVVSAINPSIIYAQVKGCRSFRPRIASGRAREYRSDSEGMRESHPLWTPYRQEVVTTLTRVAASSKEAP